MRDYLATWMQHCCLLQLMISPICYGVILFIFLSISLRHCDNKPTSFTDQHALFLKSCDTELKMSSSTCNFAPPNFIVLITSSILFLMSFGHGVCDKLPDVLRATRAVHFIFTNKTIHCTGNFTTSHLLTVEWVLSFFSKRVHLRLNLLH